MNVYVNTRLTLQEKIELIQLNETEGLSSATLARKFNISSSFAAYIVKNKQRYYDELKGLYKPRLRDYKHRKRIVCLTIKKKIALIRCQERGVSSAELAKKFNICNSHVMNILRNKTQVLELWNKNEGNSVMKALARTSGFTIRNATYEWYCQARAANKKVSRDLIGEKAKEVARSIGLPKFKPTAGWINSFIKRHKIAFTSERGGRKLEKKHVKDWLERLRSICKGYSSKDIFTCDELALFFRAPPLSDRTKRLMGKTCSGGKMAGERLTVLLCTNMDGQFEPPLVVGNTLNPSCAHDLDLDDLTVEWVSNEKAWMTRAIMTSWMTRLSKKMMRENRKILLFMDKSASHPRRAFTNIDIVFIPPNTSTLCQPLHQGIVKAVRVHYKKCLLLRLLSKASETNTSFAEEEAERISLLEASQWISTSVKAVKQEMVQDCFLKAGFPGYPKKVVEKNQAELDRDLARTLLAMINPKVDESYLDIDENLLTEADGALTVFDCMEDVKEMKESDEEEVEDREYETPLPTMEDPLYQMARLKKFFASTGDVRGAMVASSLQHYIESLDEEMK